MGYSLWARLGCFNTLTLFPPPQLKPILSYVMLISMPLLSHVLLCLIFIMTYCIYLFLSELTGSVVFLKELHYQGSISHSFLFS